MRQIIEFPLEGGGAVLVEVEQSAAAAGLTPASRPEGTLERARDTFDHALHAIKPAAEAIVKSLKDLRPDALEIKFGVKFTADAHALIASSSGEANVEVKLVWRKAKVDGAES